MVLIDDTRESGSVSAITDIDIESLAEWADSRDTLLSIYMGRGDGAFIRSRLKAMEKALPRDLRDDFMKTLDLVRDALESRPMDGEMSRAVYASGPRGFIRVFRLGLSLEPLVALSASPFLLPLARLRDDYEDYGIVLVDSRELRLYVVRSSRLLEKEHLSKDIMKRHKKGGMSQMRYSRLRKEAIKAFLLEAADDISRLPGLDEMRGLVVAGPGDAKRELLELLPKSVAGKVLGLVDISMGSSERDLLKAGDQIAAGAEADDGKQSSMRLKDAVIKGRPSAYGTKEVLEALEQGRVGALTVLKGFELPGMVCRSCLIPKEKKAVCPECGQPSPSDLLEEIYKKALETGVDIEFVEEDDFLEAVGGIGAVLRY